MNRAIKKMKDHVIVAGYDTTGAATVNELMSNGYNKNNLIVVDETEDRVRRAADAGATGILGDPSSEEILNQAGIASARSLIIATSHDDTNVLITLTAKDLNPKINIVARVSQLENIKQLDRAGADAIGLNCGRLLIDEVDAALKEMARVTRKPLISKPNAGIPNVAEGETAHPVSAEEMASHVPGWIDNGARVVSGCCGSGPDHIAQISEAVKKHLQTD